MLQKDIPRRITVAEMAPHVHSFEYKENKVNKISQWLISWIKTALEDGQIKHGDFLPAKGDLAFHIGVSKGTIQNVFRIVEDTGLIESKQKIGTYIKPTEKQIVKLTSKRDYASNKIKQYINEKNLKVGDKIPSTRQLAEVTKLSATTVRAAFDMLVGEKILSKQKSIYVIISTEFVNNEIKPQNLTEKITQQIKEYIDKNLNKGQKLPSNHELSDMFNVSVKTIHDSLKILSQEGIVITRRGKYGTFVSSSKHKEQYFYEVVEQKIKHHISKNYEIGAKLPSIRQIAADFNVSTKTIKKALDNLAYDGYVRFLRGKHGGTFVTDIPQNSKEAYTWLAINPNYLANEAN